MVLGIGMHTSRILHVVCSFAQMTPIGPKVSFWTKLSDSKELNV